MAGLPLRAENAPAGKGLDEALGNLQRVQVAGWHPARVLRVVARAQRPADDGDRVVPDVDDRPVESGALDPAEQSAHLHGQVRLLEHLPDQRFVVGLTRLDPPTGDGPEPGARLPPALDHQQAALRVSHDSTYAGDQGIRHAAKYPLRSLSATRSAASSISDNLLCTDVRY